MPGMKKHFKKISILYQQWTLFLFNQSPRYSIDCIKKGRFGPSFILILLARFTAGANVKDDRRNQDESLHDVLQGNVNSHKVHPVG